MLMSNEPPLRKWETPQPAWRHICGLGSLRRKPAASAGPSSCHWCSQIGKASEHLLRRFEARNVSQLAVRLRQAPVRLFSDEELAEATEASGRANETPVTDEPNDGEPMEFESELEGTPTDSEGPHDDEPLFADGAADDDVDAHTSSSRLEGLRVALRFGLLRRSMNTTVVVDGMFRGQMPGSLLEEPRRYVSPGARSASGRAPVGGLPRCVAGQARVALDWGSLSSRRRTPGSTPRPPPARASHVVTVMVF